MSNLIFSFPAHLFIGERKYWLNFLSEILKKELNLTNLNACPDLVILETETFGVKEAHNLINQENRGSFSSAGRYFVIAFNHLTPEAGNALLKTLEEPSFNSSFFLVTSSEQVVLPTLLSRLQIHYQAEGDYQLAEISRAQAFLGLDYPEKFEFVHDQFLKDKDKDYTAIHNFLLAIEFILAKKILKDKNLAKEFASVLAQIIKAKKYLNYPRSSARLILEQIALASPVLGE